MTTSQNKKRLDQIEAKLTPKEWAIKLAAAGRTHPTEMESWAAMAKKAATLRESPFFKAFWALLDQAEERFPCTSKTNDKNRADRLALARKLTTEFHALKILIAKVNDKITVNARYDGVVALLHLSMLAEILFQDSVGRTARKAAEWIEEYKTADAAEEASRQGMLKELSFFTKADMGETFADSMPLGPDIRLRFKSRLETWVDEQKTLITQVFAHQYAVKIIQDKYFDGHPILYRDVEAQLANTIKNLEEGVDYLHQDLKLRSQLFKMEWDENEKEDGIAGAIPGEREGHLIIDSEAIKAGKDCRAYASKLAEAWVEESQDKAKLDAMLLDPKDREDREVYMWAHFQTQVEKPFVKVPDGKLL